MTRTVVFLHGGVTGGWMWRSQIDVLSDRPTFAPDLPGYLSRRREPWSSFDSMSDRLAAMIAAQTDEPVDLVGLSMGGIAALHVAARHPALVASAFVTGVSVLPYTPAMRLGNRASLALWNTRFLWEGMARAMGLEDEARAEFVSRSPALSRRSALEQLREVQPGHVTGLEQIEAPVLALAGERETRYFHRSLKAIAAEVPDVRVGLAPGMHHGWSGEDPDLFNRVLRAWLDERRLHPDLLPLPD
ncbi:alpha/beta hydrolase [Microbacterium sp.]|uniref:alpha/beta fold hydrolase n=1 Tax=Microbacterium sp. TaxID=51671 RepID=UPI00281167F5|nr:alpha/beta hydrolase [Microbacterium sp.]